MNAQKLLFLPELASAHGGDLDRLNLYIHMLMAVLFVGWCDLLRDGAREVPRLRPPRRRSRRRAEPCVELHRGGGRDRRGHPAARLLGAALGRARRQLPRREGRGPRARRRRSSSRGTSTTRDRTAIFGKTDIKLVDAQANPLGIDKKDPAAADDFTTVNQLHLPVNKPAIVYLSSMDVIHSFGLQEMRVKQDAIPGLVTPVWFEPTVTSDDMKKRKGDDKWNYEISCAQLCGLGHYRMRGYVTIDTAGSVPGLDGLRGEEGQERRRG